MLDLSTSYHAQGDELIINRSQDCTPVAEFAKAQHNAGFHGSSEVKHAASIPMVIVEKYCNDNQVSFADFMDDPAHIKRVVEHPDNSLFRIWPGKL
jgi:hypothetical protein